MSGSRRHRDIPLNPECPLGSFVGPGVGVLDHFSGASTYDSAYAADTFGDAEGEVAML